MLPYWVRNRFHFGLASLLLFVAIVCVALGAPHVTLALVATVPFLLVGGAIIALGWRAGRHRLAVRSATIVTGLALIAAGCWVFAVMMPR